MARLAINSAALKALQCSPQIPSLKALSAGWAFSFGSWEMLGTPVLVLRPVLKIKGALKHTGLAGSHRRQ